MVQCSQYKIKPQCFVAILFSVLCFTGFVVPSLVSAYLSKDLEATRIMSLNITEPSSCELATRFSGFQAAIKASFDTDKLFWLNVIQYSLQVIAVMAWLLRVKFMSTYLTCGFITSAVVSQGILSPPFINILAQSSAKLVVICIWLIYITGLVVPTLLGWLLL